MTASRALLHLAAFILPLIALAVALWLLGGGSLRGTLPMLVAALCAAQIAALLGTALLRNPSGSRWLAPLAVGLGMALVTYLSFGPLLGMVLRIAGDPLAGKPFAIMIDFSLFSALFTGWAMAPLTMAVSVFVDRLRRKELERAAV